VAADRLAERGAEFEAELKRLAGDHANAAARLRASIAERDSRLEERARASAALRSQLDASEAENRRQFEETPVPLIRCTRDIGVAGVNRAFAALVGCRAHGELRDESVAALFESRDDLIWLIERSMNTGKTESVDTTCISRDGTRIAVRLSARACASGLVEIAVEDLTAVRVLEDRLREAHRMESVGRLASEIAVTCEKLLSDVYRDARRLLTTMTDAEAPQRSEALLDEVTRVGSFLHQLVAYGHEQAAALAPVDLNRVLRHLEPVLRQVAGDSVTLELRKASSPVNVDANAERVERLLVNVASYGRERMPSGGRLQIELSTVVVDGKFIAQHPNVRQGPHALITVTEVPRPAAQDLVSDDDSQTDARPAPNRPGVDLGVLQELISDCGGHLWITAEPGGSMVVKMRLPLRAAWADHADRRARHRIGRVTARLLGR
jgi:nitrogen-specific signal transduction histidine kinase